MSKWININMFIVLRRAHVAEKLINVMKIRCKICAVSSYPLRSAADFALVNLCSPLVLLFPLWPCAAMTTTGDAAHHRMSWPLLWQKRHSHWCTLARSHLGSHTLTGKLRSRAALTCTCSELKTRSLKHPLGTAQPRWASLRDAMSTGDFCLLTGSCPLQLCGQRCLFLWWGVYISNFCFAPFCFNHASIFSLLSSVSCSSWLLPAQCFLLEYTWNSSCILKDLSLLISWCSGGLHHKLHFCLCFSIWISFICICTKVTYKNRCKSAVSVICEGIGFSLPCPHSHGFMFCF